MTEEQERLLIATAQGVATILMTLPTTLKIIGRRRDTITDAIAALEGKGTGK